MEIILNQEQRYATLNYFPGVLRCKWTYLYLEQGGDEVIAMHAVIFYNWK
jgi:hypothetical protein